MSRSKKTPGKQQAKGRSESGGTFYSMVASSRETVESIVVAVILAFMFRAFVLEAFVIPTGSMAPTLQGRHKDVFCSECNHEYRVGASHELQDDRLVGSYASTSCPICGNTQTLKPSTNPDELSFSGDRIIVSKFLYDLRSPKRWDVIVFKYPGNAVQNYIKRLVGLPNETIRIFQGDIYTKKPEDKEATIARKPPHKIKAMLQLIDDTDYIPEKLRKVNWPSRWQPSEDSTWKQTDGADWSFELSSSTEDSLLRYYHRVPSERLHIVQDGEQETTDLIDEWEYVREKGKLPPTVLPRSGSLISDFCVYNNGKMVFIGGSGTRRSESDLFHNQSIDYRPVNIGNYGLNWVGDLAIEANVDVQGDKGDLILKLVEGGTRFQCRIDVATGEAKLAIENADFGFDTGEQPTAKTSIRGKGNHHIRFANTDNLLTLWIDENVVQFSSPTTFTIPSETLMPIVPLRPQWSEDDPGDLAPLGIGGRGLQLKVSRLRVLRDIYYIAMDGKGADNCDFVSNQFRATESNIRALFRTPEMWSTSPAFGELKWADFTMSEDQFFPLGDNSPAEPRRADLVGQF